MHGLPVAVICNGRVSYTEGSVYATPSSGRFVPTPPNSVYVYGRVEARDMVINDLLHIFTILVETKSLAVLIN